MKASILKMTAPLLLALGCASVPQPTDQMAEVQAAHRAANELGGQRNPKAQLHLKLAEEQIQKAKNAMEEDDNEKATSLLTRAKADAELAVALTRAEDANKAAQEAVDQANTQRSQNQQLGGQP